MNNKTVRSTNSKTAQNTGTKTSTKRKGVTSKISEKMKFKRRNVGENNVPKLNELDLTLVHKTKITTSAKQDPAIVTDLIRVAKFSESTRERELARKYLKDLYNELIRKQAYGYMRRGTAGKGVVVKPGSPQMLQMSDDIVSAAWEGFFRALELFDPESGTPFRGFFHFHVRHRCTREFFTQCNHLSGTEGATWLKYLKWLQSQDKSEIKKLTWEEVLDRASQHLGCSSMEINDIIRARKMGAAGVTSFINGDETEGFSGAVFENDIVCDSYEWNDRNLGGPDRGKMWDFIEEQMGELGNSEVTPTREEAAEVICAKMGAPKENAPLVANERAFVGLYRQHVSQQTDSSILAKRRRSMGKSKKSGKASGSVSIKR